MNKPKFLMIQGTGSHVGKSVITAALCRIFANQGLRVAPFKAQNMALNSYVTAEGCEVGRSTALQAKAARTELTVEMNPILLKPTADKNAQLILNGKPYTDVTAFEQFHKNKSLRTLKWDAVREALSVLSEDYDLIVMEGAGSPAEVNLREFDIVNMAVARHTGAPVLLVSDIDKGGSLASLVGTLALLPEEERAHVQGFIFNKFRGDPRLFDAAITFMKNKTGCDTLGLLPFDAKLNLMEEDALRWESHVNGDPDIDIAIIAHPYLSNFTDFDPLTLEPGLMLRFVRSVAQLGQPDAVILPGSKNTMGDLQQLKDSGLASRIENLAKAGVPIVGICGGYQMLGQQLFDPDAVESTQAVLEGLALLDVVTEFQKEKIIISFVTQINPFIYGSEGYLLIITTKNRKIEEKISSILPKKYSPGELLNFQNPNIISFHVVSNLNELSSIEKSIKPFLNEINNYEFIKIEEQAQYNFFPEGIYKSLIQNVNKK